MGLTFLRHPPPIVEHGICYGRSDVSAAPMGETKMSSLLECLPAVATVYSSPLSRCLFLAKDIAAALHVELCVDERLVELDFGRWELRRWEDIPRPEIDEWAADITGAAPHGGERVADMQVRVAAFLAELTEVGESALVVTHMGVIRCALAVAEVPGALSASLAYAELLHLPEMRRKHDEHRP